MVPQHLHELFEALIRQLPDICLAAIPILQAGHQRVFVEWQIQCTLGGGLCVHADPIPGKLALEWDDLVEIDPAFSVEHRGDHFGGRLDLRGYPVRHRSFLSDAPIGAGLYGLGDHQAQRRHRYAGQAHVKGDAAHGGASGCLEFV
ncbi:hypothetical protein D9M68_591950 [compost metagenome]